MGSIFENSPVNEVIFGMQFDGPILSTNSVMEIIDIFKIDYPEITEHPPLLSIVESPNKPKTQGMLKTFHSRKHIIHKGKNKLIQVQSDRLLFNWRKEDTTEDYPHYDVVYKLFAQIVETISKKVNKEIAKKINQYEFTYINHIYLNEFGMNEYEPSDIFNIIQQKHQLKDINLEYSIPQEDIGGVLNTSIKSAKNKNDNRKLFVLENTCRGFSSSTSMNMWFSSAHKILLDNFVNIITVKAKNIWKYSEE
jgi:uncharacterized protein (TIGR04255 family)